MAESPAAQHGRPPSAQEASELLRRTGSVATTLRAAGRNEHAIWFTGMAVASSCYVAGLGATTTDTQVLLLTAPFAIWVALLCAALLPRATFLKAGLTDRLLRSMLVWGLCFGLALGLGLTLFRGQPWFFLVAGAAVAVPLAWAAWSEMRA